MKRISLLIAVLLLLAPSAGVAAAADGGTTAAAHARHRQGEDDEQLTERTLAAEPDVTVNLCLKSGDVVVRGWDKREVRVRAEAGQVELRQLAGSGAGAAGAAAGASKPAKSVDVLLADSEDEEAIEDFCGGSGNVEIDVPRGATVVLKVREGDINVTDVAEARTESASGDTDLRRIARAVDVQNLSGDIILNDSSGRVRLLAISGDVEAANVQPNDAGEHFSAKTTSGSVSLERISHTHIEAGTVSGDVSMAGTLARGGSYEFKTFSGDVTLTLPANASFKVNATVASSGEIKTDFPVKSPSGTQPLKELSQGRLNGTVGDDGPLVNLSSFSGTVRLKKR